MITGEQSHSKLTDACFLWRGHDSIPMPRFCLALNVLTKSARMADRSDPAGFDRVYRGSPNSCFVGTSQVIRGTCPAVALMAIRVGNRIRKFSRKGGRRLGYYMTKRKV